MSLRHQLSRPGSLASDPDRGDVPGWVLSPLMTAGLVAGRWALGGPVLTFLFASAIESVSGG
jgi:hypothetical protein